jgi:hypothetical protein
VLHRDRVAGVFKDANGRVQIAGEVVEASRPRHSSHGLDGADRWLHGWPSLDFAEARWNEENPQEPEPARGLSISPDEYEWAPGSGY